MFNIILYQNKKLKIMNNILGKQIEYLKKENKILQDENNKLWDENIRNKNNR